MGEWREPGDRLGESGIGNIGEKEQKSAKGGGVICRMCQRSWSGGNVSRCYIGNGS